MAVIISESDMQFGEYDEEQVFQIDTCFQYIEKLKPNGIKSCEFILRRKDKLHFVEAKQLVLGSCQQIVQPIRLKSIMHTYTISH